MSQLRAPFPYFGGKSSVADLVWSRLGDVRNYVEPFCGSAAVLLARPHAAKVETVNDACCFITNFWRAVAQDPEAVVEACDWPVNEADLHARHRWLLRSDEALEFAERMKTDPDCFNPKIAGWWVWGLCMWIGGGWCTSREPHLKRPKLASTAGAAGVHRTHIRQSMPSLHGNGGATGRGVHRSGIWKTRPDLSGSRGVHAATGDRREVLLHWFGELRDRLRDVRVCCGDWKRVCSSRSATTLIGTTGVFLDPPYGDDGRDPGIYGVDCMNVAGEVQEWCAERGESQEFRIALCGYEGEHNSLEDTGWRKVEWQANGGYGNRSGNDNRHRERIWFSPHCEFDAGLFDHIDRVTEMPQQAGGGA